MPLSNSTQQLLNSQYYDDWYAPSNTVVGETRGQVDDYQRILFRPKFAVQSRELTQLQTILQYQLEQLTDAQFRDGEAVLGGCLSLDTSVLSGQVLPTTNLVSLFSRPTNSGKYMFDTAFPTTKLHVLQFVSADEGETTNNYLIFKPQTSDLVLPGAVVQASDDATITATFSAGANADVFSKASIVSIDDGVFFVRGFLVNVPKQTIVLNPFSDLPNFRIGLDIAEQVIDEIEDPDLLDPANQNAPGAHRFRIVLTLDKRSLATDADTGFIELARVVDGQLLNSKKTPKFVRLDELNKILARRTYDEAGDYIVKPFTPVIETNPADANTFILSLGPGKAYVRGYEVNTSQPTKKVIRKGRESADANNRTLPLPVGSFVYATRLAATVPANYFGNTAVVDIHCCKVADIDPTSNVTYTRSRIGQAKVRMTETFEVPIAPSEFANNTVRKLFFYDVVGDQISGNVASASVNNVTAITCVLPIAQGTPHVNSAIEGATIVLGGASSPVSGTFTVNNYVYANATHAFATLREFLPTLPNGNTTYKLIFQMKDVDSFALWDANVSTIDAPYSPSFAFQADVHVDSKIGGIPTGNTIVSDTTDNTLLYQIPEKFAKANSISVNSAIWKSWVKTSANAQGFSGASNIAFTITVSGNNFGLPVGTLDAAVAAEFLVIFDQTNDVHGHGVGVNFYDTPGATDRCISNVSIAQSGTDYNVSFTYHFGAASGTTRSLVGIAKTTVTGLPVRTKTLMLGSTANVYSSTNLSLNKGQVEFYSLNATAGFAYSAHTTDVFRISKVLYKDSNTVFADADLATATDVTSHFSLDNGQRDNSYEYSNFIVGPRASSVVRPTGRLLFIFDWFKNSGRGYATLDSYLSSTNLGNGMTYDIIPDYTSPKLQRSVNLRDVLDFRPMRSNFEFVNTALQFAASDQSTNTTYLTVTNESYLIPVSDDVWLGSYSYFLSRIDKIALAFDGNFKVIEGTDAVSPSTPADVSGTLLLFQLNVPSYTLVNGNGVPISVKLTTFGHKRYTMQDVSKIDERVSHLEYYTQLNSLESITKNTPVLDSDDNERFKNGIVVDTFHGGETADLGNLDFTASLDTAQGELHTAYRSFAMQFAPDLANSTSFGVSLIGDMAILSFNVATFIAQPLATHAISVNPFDVASFYGTLSLSPSVDIWKDVETAPAQIVDLGGPTQTWQEGNAPTFTNWGEWEQTWSGVTSSKPHGQQFTPPGWTPQNHAFGSLTDLSWNDVTTTTTYQQQGTAFEFNIQTNTADLGNQVVDVSIVHNIRRRDVVFSGIGLKPGANLYAYFDGTAVTKYVQQANVLQLHEVAAGVSPFYQGQTLYVEKPLTGFIATTNGVASFTGSNTQFSFELVPGQYVRVTQGVSTFDALILTVDSNTNASFAVNSSITLANAVLSTLTPVTVADVAPFYTGSVVQYNLKVVRAVRDADNDQAVPYPITAGSLRPQKQVKDTANTTVGAFLIIPASARQLVASTMNIADAVCGSGVVRDWNSGTGAIRFDLDITDSLVATPGTTIYFPQLGVTANVVSYNAAIQTAILDNATLNIVANKTLYSAGQPKADGFIDANTVVTTGRAGTIGGVFHVPTQKFATGTRLFRLTDNINNNSNDATTAAETNYEASGISYTQQDVTVSSRSLGIRDAGVRTQSLNVQDTTVNGFSVQYLDPLAETFLVDSVIFPQGVFVVSVDLCFASKPSDDIPVIVEIRPVVNGYPASNKIVPCVSGSGLATVQLRPDQVNVTAAPDMSNPATVTTFTLPAPVQLMPGQEYAIIVRSDSDVYKVYTAQLGGAVIGSDAVVAKQPYAGSFFKSQNASAWTESPFEDLMFRLNRAVWTNATPTNPVTGILVARGVAPDSNTSFDSYELFPHDVQFSEQTQTSYQLDIKPENLVTEDLTGEIAVRYNVIPNMWSLLQSRSMLQGYGGSDAANNVLGRALLNFSSPDAPAMNTIDALCTLSTTSPDVAPFIDMKKMNVLCLQHLINDMQLYADEVVIVNPGAGYNAQLANGKITTVGGSPTVSGDGNTNFLLSVAAGDTVVVGGNLEIIVSSVTNSSQFVATANVSLSRAANDFWTYGALGGNNTTGLTIAGGDGSGAAGYAVVGRNGKVTGIVLTANGSGYTGTPTLTVAAPTAPGGDYTVAQTTALLGYNSELAASGGNGLTRYIIRPVTLTDGFDARDLTVTFDAYRPLGSKFHVYYKVLPGDADTARFDDQPWRAMVMTTPDGQISTNYNMIKEFNFATPNNKALDSSTDTTDTFKVFAIKVVIASTGTVDVPRIENFRAIALDQ